MERYHDEDVEWGPPTLPELKQVLLDEALVAKTRHTTIGLLSTKLSPELAQKNANPTLNTFIDLCSESDTDESPEYSSANECEEKCSNKPTFLSIFNGDPIFINSSDDEEETSSDAKNHQLVGDIKEEQISIQATNSSTNSFNEECGHLSSHDDISSFDPQILDQIIDDTGKLLIDERSQFSVANTTKSLENESDQSLMSEGQPDSHDSSQHFNDTFEEMELLLQYGLDYDLSIEKTPAKQIQPTTIPTSATKITTPAICSGPAMEFRCPLTPNLKKKPNNIAATSLVAAYIHGKTIPKKRKLIIKHTQSLFDFQNSEVRQIASRIPLSITPTAIRSQPPNVQSSSESDFKTPKNYQRLIPRSEVRRYANNTLDESAMAAQIQQPDLTMTIDQPIQ